MIAALLLACAPADPVGPVGPTDPVDPDGPTDPVEPAATWTIAVWMAGDNDLEALVTHDLDELERGVSPGVNVVVQADRIPGYDDRHGDWTGTRRYAMVADQERGAASPVLEDLGEIDMGSPDALADFLLWADERFPAERFALVLWNHGGGFWIASDETSGSRLDLGEGELSAALAPLAARRGRPLDVIGFDACNMAQWETALSLAEDASVFVASPAWVDWGGFAYDTALPEVAALGTDAGPVELASALARSAVVDNLELTQTVVDLGALDPLDEAVDALAGAWLADPALLADFVRARSEARGLDRQWDEFWMDLGSLADAAARSEDAAVRAAAADVLAALDGAVLATWTDERLSWTSGLTVFADSSRRGWLDRYARGPWAEETRWDELVTEVARAGY